MGMIIAGLIVFGLVTAAAGLQFPVLWPVLGVVYGIYATGFALVLLGHKRPGARLVFVSSIAFVPVGIIGMLGARKILDQVAQQEFQQRQGERHGK